MIRFMAWQLVRTLVYLQGVQYEALDKVTSGNGNALILQDDVEKKLVPLLAYARSQCVAVELQSSVSRIDEQFSVALKLGATYDVLFNEAKTLRETIQSELQYKRFAFVPTDRAIKFDNIDKDWAEVQEKFLLARDDIRDAVECYALDKNTASVFHSIRVAEYGLRRLAKRLGIKKLGKQQVAVEYADWGTILNEISAKLKAAQQLPGRSARKAALTKFYADAASHADHLNEIWRKDVSHARGPYNAPEALNALTRVQAFMELLCKGPT
jgi:hypothetical protein